MKVRAKLTKRVLSKLITSRELHQRQTSAGTVVEITERGHERLRDLYSAWQESKSKYSITVPDSPYYCPAAFHQKSVN
jgi:CTP-dependent riboflavin kinase